MIEIFRSNNPVELSAIEAELQSRNIDCLIADQFTSVIEGSIGAIPRRILVLSEDEPAARHALQEVLNDASE